MNLRPLEPHSSALPDCATSRREAVDRRRQQACQQKHPVFLQTAPPAPCGKGQEPRHGLRAPAFCPVRKESGDFPAAAMPHRAVIPDGWMAGTRRPAASRSLYGVRTCHRWLPAKGHQSGWERYALRSALCPPPAWSRPGRPAPYGTGHGERPGPSAPQNRKGTYVSVDPLGFLFSGRDERI